MKFLRIAVRNVFRNPRRTAFTMLVIVFGAVAMLLAGGFITFNFEGLREMTIRNGLGHLQIFTSQYAASGEEHALANGIERPADLEKWLMKQPHVVVTTQEIELVGLISNGDKSETFIGRGIDPARQETMGFDTRVKSGRALDPHSSEPEVVLGSGLAETMKVKIGEPLTLLSTTTLGALNAVDVRVVGTFSTGIKEFDARALKVTVGTAQTLLDTNRVTKIIVRLDDTKNTNRSAATIAAALKSSGHSQIAIKTWRDLATFYKQVVMLYASIFIFLGIIIFILVILSSSNTMMMTVLERVQEIGTLLALGTRRRQIVLIFLLEGLVIGFFGGLLGWVAGYGALSLINRAGITMPPPPSFSRGISLHINFVPELFAGVLLLVTIVLVLSAMIPAVRASRLRIVDALRHV
ncbi:MAG TPA: FtsX-like permease family protein [Thermoanaerobaculia bacterium]